MKDNLPNYLNPHNIDPSRIEPAHIDTPPGNDSIRPGMNIGTVAVVGKGRPKLQLPTMSNAEAIEVLKHIETDIYGRIAIVKAIDALSSPWVKTSDRPPTEADADELGRVLLMCVVDKWCNCVPVSTIDADEEWFWTPIPPLPEVEE